MVASRQSAGGLARAARLSAEERSEIARRAAAARWGQRSDAPEYAFVYAVGASDGPQKIGHAQDVRARLSGIQTGNHAVLLVTHKERVPAALVRDAEAYAHHLLEEHRIRGEWFDVEASQVGAILAEACAAVERGLRAPPRRMAAETAVRSLRLTVEAWAWVLAQAQRDGTNANALIARLVDEARFPAQVLVADASPRIQSPSGKRAAPVSMVETARTPALQLGPSPRAPGSMLIDKKGKR